MISINLHASSATNRMATSSTSNAEPVFAVSSDKEEPIAASTSNGEVTNSTVSILAHQLSEAAARAEKRAGSESENPFHSITGDNYIANKKQHGAALPNTDNPELLARARQANGFVDGIDSNPFKGLARDQLSLIARDVGGAFTLNERRSAWEELQATATPMAANPKLQPANGRDHLISRLYGGVEPPVAKPPATVYNGTQNHADFLNPEDRALISDMYAYAAAEGADLRFVDHVAIALGTYRHYSDGLQFGGSNVRYDGEGYQVTFDFKPEDAAIASSVLEGSAINSTRIDQGFLRHILDPAQGAFTNIGGIPFLEKMVKKFSNEGADQPPLASQFATYHKVRYEDHIVQTTNKDVRLPPFKALTDNVNGVWTLTEHGKAEGYTLDKTTGRISKPVASFDSQTSQRSILDDIVRQSPKSYFADFVAGDREAFAMRRIWPGHFFMLMKNQ